jgi:hypothetical protein
MDKFTFNQSAAARSQWRDMAANDNMNEFQFAQMRRDMTRWAQSRVNEPEFTSWCWSAMCQAQSMRRVNS